MGIFKLRYSEEHIREDLEKKWYSLEALDRLVKQHCHSSF